MLLDTSDSAWDMFLQIVRKAKQANTVWYSPKEKKPYTIKSTTDTSITIKCQDAADSVLGLDGFKTYLGYFNQNNGRISRTYSKPRVAKAACIVNFHPLLKWTSSNDFIEVITNPISGLIKYDDFGNPPNDDISELQTFARKVRKGQVKFREQLLKAYDGKCGISDCDVTEALDACHIESHAIRGINEISNGIILRSDLHNLFDLALIFIEPATYSIHVHPKLQGSEYQQYHGRTLRCNTIKPGDEYLAGRWKEKNW